MEKIILDFLDYLNKELNYSEETIKSYKIDIEAYKKYLDAHRVVCLDITREDILGYLKFLDGRKLKNSTIARKVSALRSFYNYLVDINIIENNLFKTIKNPKLERKLPNFLSYEEIREILNSIDVNTDEGLQNRLIIEMFYATGCRVSELVNIKINDIDLSSKKINIKGKGNKERTVYYGEYAAEFLDKYLKKRPFSESDYLFVNRNGESLKVSQIEIVIKKMIDKLSLKHHVTPHTFRHTFATHLLNNGADIKTVQELLGHSNLNTTGIYTHVTNDRLRSVYLDKFPRK